MSDQPKPTSERARKRASGKILREASIKRRESYFDLPVSGYSVEQIAWRPEKPVGGPSRRRSGVGEPAASTPRAIQWMSAPFLRNLRGESGRRRIFLFFRP